MPAAAPYRLLDSGNLRKLEQAGTHRIIRPALNAFWAPALPAAEWDAAEAEFVRDESGRGRWTGRKPLPPQWELEWGGFRIPVKPTAFGHLGFFAEQFRNWDMFRRVLPQLGPEPRALNLFGYSGLGTMAMAQGGAAACHLDASKGMIDWGREIQAANPSVPDRIRWIADDVTKFCQRELRRDSRYQAIALDPPTFGRGSSGQLWKIETDLPKLLELCRQLLRPKAPGFITLSCHSPGFTVLVMERLLRQVFGSRGEFESAEMSIPESTGRELAAGISVTLRFDGSGAGA